MIGFPKLHSHSIPYQFIFSQGCQGDFLILEHIWSCHSSASDLSMTSDFPEVNSNVITWPANFTICKLISWDAIVASELSSNIFVFFFNESIFSRFSKDEHAALASQNGQFSLSTRQNCHLLFQNSNLLSLPPKRLFWVL